MVPFSDPSDLEAIWRPLTDAERTAVAGRMAEASQMIRDEIPIVGGFTVDERIYDGSLQLSTVQQVVIAMVRRVSINPDGDSSVTEQTGPFSVTRTKSRAIATGEMFISGRERSRLMGRGRSGQVAYEITLGTGPVFT